MGAPSKKLAKVLKELSTSGDPRPLLIEHLGFDHPASEAIDRSRWAIEWAEAVEDARFLAQKADFRVAHVVVRPDTPLRTWRAVAARILVDYEGMALVLVRASGGLRWLWSSPSLERRRTAGDLREGIRHITVEIGADGGAPTGFLKLLSEVDVTKSSTGLEVLATVSSAFDSYTMVLQQDIGRNAFEAMRVLSEGLISRQSNELSRTAKTLEAIRPEVFTLLYRFLFVLYAEAREIFPVMHSVYRDRYSLAWWKEEVTLPLEKGDDAVFKRYGGARGVGLWERCQDLFALIKSGSGAHKHKPSEFYFRAYYGTIFDEDLHRNLLEWEVPNEELAEAVRLLTRFKDEGGSTFFVDYSSLEVRHLGSIYERLLEYHLTLDENGHVAHTINTLDRKSTGSYFTPSALIARLVAGALDPVLQRLKADAGSGKPSEFEARVYALRICDPAMGSGHFLVGVLDHLTRAILEHRRSASVPDGGDDEAVEVKRTIVRRCLYGVDRNKLAVELAKMSLWLETVNSERPLSFLDAHLKAGNSLVGAWFKALSDPQKSLMAADIQRHVQQEVLELIAIERQDEVDSVEVQSKVQRYRKLRSPETSYGRLTRLLDAQVSGFFGVPLADWRAARDVLGDDGAFRKFLRNPTWEAADTTARRVGFFHWELEFPEVFYDERGKPLKAPGFDVVVGNPPWDKIKVLDVEFFRYRDARIAEAQTGALRERRLKKLSGENPALWKAYEEAQKDASDFAAYLRGSGQFGLSAKGDINYYPLFVERALRLTREGGLVGIITPTGLVTDFGNQEFFSSLVRGGQLRSVEDFENKGLFPDVDDRFKFSLLVISKSKVEAPAKFTFYLRAPQQADEPGRNFELTAKEIELFNPNTRTVPLFRSRRDAAINKKMYRAAGGVLVNEALGDLGNPWKVTAWSMFHMTNDSRHFRTRKDLEKAGWRRRGNRFVKGDEEMIPLIEGKMIHLWNPRFATYEGVDDEELNRRDAKARDATAEELADPKWEPLPRFWVRRDVVDEFWGKVGWKRNWVVVFRDIARATDERTAIQSFAPALALGNKSPALLIEQSLGAASRLVANMSSLPFDYAARNKVGSTNMNFFILHQLPTFGPRYYSEWNLDGRPLGDAIAEGATRLAFTSASLRNIGPDTSLGPQLSMWDEDQRFADMRLLDAIYARLYGLTRDEFAHILDTFPIVRENDIARWGRFRTKEDALKAFDGLEGRLSRT